MQKINVMILYELNKKRDQTKIIFEENLQMDPTDKWFIDIKSVRIKSGKISSLTTIIRSDMEKRLEDYLNKGWEIKK